MSKHSFVPPKIELYEEIMKRGSEISDDIADKDFASKLMKLKGISSYLTYYNIILALIYHHSVCTNKNPTNSTTIYSMSEKSSGTVVTISQLPLDLKKALFVYINHVLVSENLG